MMITLANSVDSHMGLTYMPYDAFTSGGAQKWKDRVPHSVETWEVNFGTGMASGCHALDTMAWAWDDVMWASDYPHLNGTWRES